jgi:hypothetical protein
MNECQSKKERPPRGGLFEIRSDVLLGDRDSSGALPVPATADQINSTKAEGEDIGSRL